MTTPSTDDKLKSFLKNYGDDCSPRPATEWSQIVQRIESPALPSFWQGPMKWAPLGAAGAILIAWFALVPPFHQSEAIQEQAQIALLEYTEFSPVTEERIGEEYLALLD